VSIAEAVDPIEGYEWELYNVAEDFSQSQNMVESNPEKLKELQRLFYFEAVKYNVLPLDNSVAQDLVVM